MTEGTSAISQLLRETELVAGFKNWLILFCAEQYRRCKDDDSSLSLASECSNPALSLAWRRWYDRCHSAGSGVEAVE